MWTKEGIQKLLMENDAAVERALLTLLEEQTIDEQDRMETRHHNDRGFTGVDAEWMTSMAFRVRSGTPLSCNQLRALRKPGKRFHSPIGKYHRQLMIAAYERGYAVDLSHMREGKPAPEKYQMKEAA